MLKLYYLRTKVLMLKNWLLSARVFVIAATLKATVISRQGSSSTHKYANHTILNFNRMRNYHRIMSTLTYEQSEILSSCHEAMCQHFIRRSCIIHSTKMYKPGFDN